MGIFGYEKLKSMVRNDVASEKGWQRVCYRWRTASAEARGALLSMVCSGMVSMVKCSGMVSAALKLR